MRRYAPLFAIVFALSATAQQPVATKKVEPVEGRRIRLTAGEAMTLHAPLTLPCDAPTPEGKIVAVEGKTGKRHPVTLADGVLWFVPEGAMPRTTHTYTLDVQEKTPPIVRIEKRDGQDALDVHLFDEHFTTYHYSNDNKKPFLWPVNSVGGVPVTRGFPMADAEDTDDHVHHRSLYTAYGDLNGVDCWSEGGGSGFQHTKRVAHGSGDAFGWIRAENVWQNAERNPVIDEERLYRFYAPGAGLRLIDAEITFAASYGDVTFGDTKEGGIMTARVRDAIRTHGGGVITNAKGGKGESACWGKPAAWCDYSGAIEGKGVHGIAILDAPANLRHPTRWHVRDYGLMGANCFGLSYFTAGQEPRLNGDYLLEDGETLTFRYRVVVHEGDAEQAGLAARYANYADPPRVEWLEEGRPVRGDEKEESLIDRDVVMELESRSGQNES
jgi:hypothetical protein